MKTFLPFLLILVLITTGCIINVEDLSEPLPEPDGVSYINDVQPIFNARCTSCHGSNGGISFTSYSNTTSGTGLNYGTDLIIPGNAAASGLVDKLGVNPRFGARMPLGGSLTSQEIATITSWINDGALNN